MKRRLKDNLLASALALTVAAPMSYVTHLSLGLAYSGWYVLLFSMASILILEIIGWNRVTAIAIPSAILLVSGFAWWTLDAQQRQPFADFYWWAIGFIYGGGDFSFGYGIILTAIATFLTTLCVWLFGKKFFFFPAVFTFVAAVVLVKWLNGLDGVLAPGMLACGGLILLWAKSFQRKVAKKTGKKLPVNGIALFLLPAAACVVLLGLVTATEESSKNWQDRQVHDFFQRVNNFIADYTQFNRPRNSFSIGIYGFMPMGNRLGGPTKLSDMEVMYVAAPRRMLLRGTVYNNYTGNLWTNTANSERRRFSGGADAARKDAFDLERPELTGAARDEFMRFVEPMTISVQPLLNSSSTLFVPFRGITGVSSNVFLAVLPYYNSAGEVFSSSDVLAGYNYKVKADYLIYNVGGFDGMMGNLTAMGLKDPPERKMYIQQNYLSLPGGIEASVYSLTESIVQGKANDYEKAIAIREYLKKNCKYTLSPVAPPEASDFVSYFVSHDPNGYCTYYASAMAVMARIAGIPSRYVEGYQLPGKAPGDSVYTVRGSDAHAWTELYFEGIGWIPFDATPSGESAGPETGGNTGFIEPIPTPPHDASDSTGEYPLNTDTLTWDDIVSRLWLLPAAALALAVIWALAMMVRAKARVSPQNVKRRYRDARRRCAFYYFELLRLLGYYNYPVKPGETPYAYGARMDRWLRLQSGTFSEVANIIALISYSDYEPTQKDVDTLAGIRRDLAKYTYQTVGPLYYLWQQVLGFGRKANRPPPGD